MDGTVLTRFSGSKTVYTHVYLHSAAFDLLERSEHDNEGKFYTSMMSLVATAFFAEAYFNHLGTRYVPRWMDYDRCMPGEKLHVLLRAMAYKPDLRRRPYQSLGVVFKLRNLLAHGRTTTVSGVWRRSDRRHTSPLTTEWEKRCTSVEARLRFEDCESVVRELHRKAGYKRDPFRILAWGSSEEVV